MIAKTKESVTEKKKKKSNVIGWTFQKAEEGLLIVLSRDFGWGEAL